MAFLYDLFGKSDDRKCRIFFVECWKYLNNFVIHFPSLRCSWMTEFVLSIWIYKSIWIFVKDVNDLDYIELNSLCVTIPYGLRLNTSCELTEFGKGNDMRCRVCVWTLNNFASKCDNTHNSFVCLNGGICIEFEIYMDFLQGSFWGRMNDTRC